MICSCKALGAAPPGYRFCPFCGLRLPSAAPAEVDLSRVLKLERAIGVFDLETTGTDPAKDRIVQISITSHHPDKEPIRWQTLVNPGIPIPKAASDVHGITDEKVQDAPTWKTVATQLAPRMASVDLSGYNAKRFDVELFRAECERHGVSWPWKGHTIDPLVLWRLKRPMTLTDAYEYFTGHKLDGAHDAHVDVRATEAVLVGMFDLWPDLPRTVPELSALLFPVNPNAIDPEGKFVWNEDGDAVVAFGKHTGKLLGAAVRADRRYFEWLVNQTGAPEFKGIIRGALRGVLPLKGA